MSKNNMLVVTERRKSTDREVKFQRISAGLYKSSNGYIIAGNGGCDIWGHPMKADAWYIYTADSFHEVKERSIGGRSFYSKHGDCVGVECTYREAKEKVIGLA